MALSQAPNPPVVVAATILAPADVGTETFTETILAPANASSETAKNPLSTNVVSTTDCTIITAPLSVNGAFPAAREMDGSVREVQGSSCTLPMAVLHWDTRWNAGDHFGKVYVRNPPFVEGIYRHDLFWTL